MCELAHGWEVRIAATHIVLLFGPRRVRFQQQCYHRLRFTALLHRGDVQRQPPILSTSQAQPHVERRRALGERAAVQCYGGGSCSCVGRRRSGLGGNSCCGDLGRLPYIIKANNESRSWEKRGQHRS